MEVAAPLPNAAFHPKLWVLRYRERHGDGICYRVVCATRNLTFDRCWDTAIVLDGELTDRVKAFAPNHPLADFIRERAAARAAVRAMLMPVVWSIEHPVATLAFFLGCVLLGGGLRARLVLRRRWSRAVGGGLR